MKRLLLPKVLFSVLALASFFLFSAKIEAQVQQQNDIFSSVGASWLYSAPTGAALDISGLTSGMKFFVNTHDGGFDYPVQFADGSDGYTTFTDTAIYNFKDKITVPNPPGGFRPSFGGYGANDGHLIIVDMAHKIYYDFWKLSVNPDGSPVSDNVGYIVSGNLDGNGVPGTTGAGITGLAGDIMPGELDCETCLNHALNVVVPYGMNSNILGFEAPAVKSDGNVASGIFREGAKIALDPSFNVNTTSASVAAKAIMRALQLYGGVITDQSGGKGISFYSNLQNQPDISGLNEIGKHLLIFYGDSPTGNSSKKISTNIVYYSTSFGERY